MIKKLLQKKCAILVIDLQNDYVHPDGVMAKFGLGVTKIQKTLPSINKFLAKARQTNLPIIHTQMTEDENEIADALKQKLNFELGNPTNWSLAKKGTWGHEFAVLPQEGELVFDKNNYDIFTNPKLEEYLQQNKITTLIVLGGYTHVCVDTSVRSAMTKGYEVILATDLVCSPDKFQDLHDSSLKILGKLFAYSTTSEEIMKLIDASLMIN